jgi:predicted MPP superfamily phosphohydrolase
MKYAFMAIGLLLVMISFLWAHVLHFEKAFIPHMGRRAAVITTVVYLVLAVCAFLLTSANGGIGHVTYRTIGWGILLTGLYVILLCLCYDLIRMPSAIAQSRSFEGNPFVRLYSAYNAFDADGAKHLLGNRVARIICCCLIAVLGVTVTVAGRVHAQQIVVKTVDINIDKRSGIADLNAVLITDLHMGAQVDKAAVAKMVTAVNALHPDVIFIAGDLFDNNFDALVDPEGVAALFRTFQTQYGVYACLGNHDVDGMSISDVASGTAGSYDKIEAFLADAGMILLDDASAPVPYMADLTEEVILSGYGVDFYVIGRKEPYPVGMSKVERKPIEAFIPIHSQAPVIVLDHRPDEIDETIAAGADLVLSGHTHKGQVFPGNILLRLFNKYTYGVYTLNGGTGIVTSGIGTWGPPYRIASDCEIMQMKLHFEKRVVSDQ